MEKPSTREIPYESQHAAIAIAINDSNGEGSDGLPQWIKLVPAGTFQCRDDRGPFTLADPDEGSPARGWAADRR
jgi:hypothetical protein